METIYRTLKLLLLATAALGAQTTHSVTLTWTDTLNPSGTTYNVYRATGSCSGTPSFSLLTSAVTAKTYQDPTVTPGSYCYGVTAVLSGSESAKSNLVNPVVPPFIPTALTFQVQ